MKPVLETIIDKNGGKTIRFNPSARMILFLAEKGKNPHMTDEEVLEKLGIDTHSARRWELKYGHHYTDWYEEMLDQHLDSSDQRVLDMVGMVEAVQGNFNFWKEMSKIRGLIKEDTKEIKITLNTDFSKFEGMSFEDYRRGILESTRGVEYSPRPGLAQRAGVGQRQGPGVRTIPVQARSMEIPDPLGEDRGRPERDGPIPALSERTTPIRPNTVLAAISTPSSTEEPSDDGDLAF